MVPAGKGCSHSCLMGVDARGTFNSHVIGKDQGRYDTRAVDMDGDGDLDLLIAGHGRKNVVWPENSLK